MTPALMALVLLAGLQASYRTQLNVRFQRDAAVSASPTALGRTSYLRPLAELDGDVRVVILAGEHGARLDWPGIETIPSVGTTLISPALARHPHETLQPLLSGSVSGVLHNDLLVHPNELVMLQVGEQGGVGQVPIDPGFAATSPGSGPSPTLLIVAVLAVAIPAFALASSAASSIIERSRPVLVQMRVLGATPREATGAVGLMVAGATFLAGLVAVSLFAAVAQTSAVFKLGSFTASTLSSWPDLSTMVGLTLVVAVVAAGSAYRTAKKLVVRPWAAHRGEPTRSSRRLHWWMGAAATTVVFTAVVVAFRDQLPEWLAVISMVAAIGAVLWASTGLALGITRHGSNVLPLGPTEPIVRSTMDTVINRFGHILAPLGWGTGLMGIVIGVVPVLETPPPLADMVLIPVNDAALGGNSSASQIARIEGVETAIVVHSTEIEATTVASVHCDDLRLMMTVPDQCGPNVVLVPASHGPIPSALAGRTPVEWEPPADFTAIVAPEFPSRSDAPNFLDLADFDAWEVFVQLDWTVPPDTVADELLHRFELFTSDVPRQRFEATNFQESMVVGSLLASLAASAVLTAVAFFLAVATTLASVADRFALLHLFGVRRRTCISVAATVVTAPLVALVSLPAASGVGFANAWRTDDGAVAALPPLTLVVGGAAVLLLFLIIIVRRMGALDVLAHRSE